MSVPYGNSQPPQDPSPQPGYPMGAPAYGVPYGAPQMAMLPPELAALPGASFGEAVRRFFHRYAQFRGAASVSELLWPWLLQILVVGGLIMIGGVSLAAGAIPAETVYDDPGTAGWAVAVAVPCMIAAGIFNLAVIIPAIAVQIRRLHDTGKSGAWWFISLIPGGGLVLLILLLMPSKPELFRPEWA